MIENPSCAYHKMTRKLLVLLPLLTTVSEAAAQQSRTPVKYKVLALTRRSPFRSGSWSRALASLFTWGYSCYETAPLILVRSYADPLSGA